MRSLNYLAAALPVFGAAYAGAGFNGGDETVVVTTTRYVTVCPIEFWTTCDAGDGGFTPTTRSGGPTITTTTTTTPTGPITTGIITSTITGYNGSVITTTITGFNQTTTSIPNLNTTSTSTCYNASRTAAPFDQDIPGFGSLGGNGAPNGNGFAGCNQAGSRSSWCNGQSINNDPQTLSYSTGQTRYYTLTLTDCSVDADGTGAIDSFCINGKTPGEPIVANWGDEVVINVINNLSTNTTTIHWHGIQQHQTNDQDGVPGVTECGIAPGQSRTYTWIASTYGTAWYHSHALSQYGGGIRGPIIIHGPATADYDIDLGPVMVDEKFGDSIFNMAVKQQTARGAIPAPNYLLNGMNTNINATTGQSATWIFKAGKKHLFRFINSAAQTAFAMHIDQHTMTVISADLMPINPYTTDTLYIHSGQRYTVVVEANQPPAAYYLRGIAQKGCGAPIVNDGNGIANGIVIYETSCYDVPGPSNFTLDTTTICADEPLSSLVPYIVKDGGSAALFQQSVEVMPAGSALGVVYPDSNSIPINTWRMGPPTNFTGAANGTGVASVNVNYTAPTLQLLNQQVPTTSSAYSSAVVLSQANQWSYWIIQNAFIAAHPMHLHGHDFSVLGQKSNAIFGTADIQGLNFINPMRRDTVLLWGGGAPTAPLPGWTVIGFQTNNPGAWLMHCHIIWHADGGMGMQFIERPADIPSSYATSAAFTNECSSLQSYQAANPSEIHATYESGIKIRHLEDHKFRGHHGHSL